MRVAKGRCCGAFVGFLSLVLLGTNASARVQYPVAAAYEDTVRVMVVYNFGATGVVTECPWYVSATTPGSKRVGTETFEFVTAALEGVKNIKSMYTTSARADSVKNAFGPGKAPHVLVHVNAGWGGTAGQNFGPVQDYALNNSVGMVAVGDDEMTTLAPSFPWSYQMDMWQPMGTATSLRNPGDRLFMVMDASKDNTIDSAAYPNLNGVIRNARSIAGADTVEFKPVEEGGRCEADADVLGFAATDADKIKLLAYEQGYNAASGADVANAWDYCVVTTIQDSLQLTGGGAALRRAVSLSMQPQYVNNTAAMHQLVYDAIMYASLVHTKNPQPPFSVGIREHQRRTLTQMRLPSGASVRITDMAGRTVYEGPALAGVDLRTMTSRWQSGVYVMTAKSSGSDWSSTFTVAR